MCVCVLEYFFCFLILFQTLSDIYRKEEGRHYIFISISLVILTLRRKTKRNTLIMKIDESLSTCFEV